MAKPRAQAAASVAARSTRYLAFMDFWATVATGAAARTETEAAERADISEVRRMRDRWQRLGPGLSRPSIELASLCRWAR